VQSAFEMGFGANSTRRQIGFTLLELIVVIAIIATLVSVVGPQVFRNVGDAKLNAARSQIEMFGLALESYRLDNGGYPSTVQGLAALRVLPVSGEPPVKWRGPYLRRAIPELAPGHSSTNAWTEWSRRVVPARGVARITI
jgi:general secretion pathway protein G